MKNTPIETAIEQIKARIENLRNEYKIFGDSKSVKNILDGKIELHLEAIDILTSLLPEERKEIEEAYGVGRINGKVDDINFKGQSDYFDKTYSK